VTVVWARSPTSARPGDTALVTADGRMQGWVGGSCSEGVVVREALASLADASPRLVHLGPPADLPPEREGMVVVPTGCASEGSLELFVEPHLPPAHLVVVGRAPLVAALATMAGAVGFDVSVVEREAGAHALDLAAAGTGPHSFVVVATMGRYDEDALEAALATGARYVALVASDRRAAAVKDSLRAAGVAEADVARVRAPAGLELGDLPHLEIAVAILAEVVEKKATMAVAAAPEIEPAPAASSEAQPAEAIDPVCHMTVDLSTPHDTAQHAGVTYHFCCSPCRRRFEKDPDRYLVGADA
jgi:xanthine dehydrogenase accessory factor